MRRTAIILAALAGFCCVAIGVYLLALQPEVGKHWMQQWLWETGVGHTFHIHGAATLFGSLAIVFGVVILTGAAVIPKHFVAVGMVLVLLDMVACMVIAICPDPAMAVYVWAVPGLLLAFVGFLLGIELQRVHEPEGVAEVQAASELE